MTKSVSLLLPRIGYIYYNLRQLSADKLFLPCNRLLFTKVRSSPEVVRFTVFDHYYSEFTAISDNLVNFRKYCITIDRYYRLLQIYGTCERFVIEKCILFRSNYLSALIFFFLISFLVDFTQSSCKIADSIFYDSSLQLFILHY